MPPPKPVLSLTVGVIGHRPNRLSKDALPAIERSLLATFKSVAAALTATRSAYGEYFGGAETKASMVTGLAEGADSLAARIALPQGYALDVILPFARREYEKDFSGEHLSALRELLTRSRTVLELCGDRANEGKSYEASGIAILDASDIVIAVWDGGASAGRGGTAELVTEAGRRGVPIIHIDAKGHSPAQIIWQGLEARQRISSHILDHPSASLESKIDFVVDATVRPPASSAEREGLQRFLAEPQPPRLFRVGFPLLMAAFFARLPKWSDLYPKSPQQLAASVALPILGGEKLAIAFGWADAVGTRFSQTFRSTFVDNFLFSALAVLAGALSVQLRLSWPFASAEVLLIGWILVNIRFGLKRHWHQRWVEPREVAERLRVALPMTVLGSRPLGPYGEASAWTNWYVRALLRDSGIISGKLDSERLALARNALRSLLESQSEYQRVTEQRMASLNRRMRRVGELLLSLTVVAVLMHMLVDFRDIGFLPAIFHVGIAKLSQFVPESALAVLSNVLLPAMGAAFFGIRTLGDFEGTAKRAARMHGELNNLLKATATLAGDFHSLRGFSFLIADVMLGDVASWRLSAESRGLSVPG